MRIEDGILFVQYSKNLNITLDIAKICVYERLKLSDGKNYPMLADIRNIKNTDHDAKNYIAQGDGTKGIIAGAFIVKNEFNRFLATIFINLSLIKTPKLPAKLFSNEEDAIQWLQQFKVTATTS
ncbi:MAG TPA: STAS/SEC14 domain-containing protein [Bacteroidia bacterium]|nr:STAS/SEC14 domain-containing protein [Bacteroidia bacterium]